LVLLGWMPVAGYATAIFGATSLYLLSTPAVASALVNLLQARHKVLSDLPGEAQVIVVLGGGRNREADEYGGDTVEHFTLERLRYAARLRQRTGLPILTSGGCLYGEPRSEASLMKEVLEQDFKTPVRWTEGRSRDTLENARYAACMLREQGLNRILLVTHGWHMRRAVWCFEREGLEVIPAPTGYASHRRAHLFLPHYRGLYLASNALSEYLAIAWYWLRYGRRS
jgi:uncharacterized SAM-binding protein YcdF (DUF218 family)